jgi:hypothetical protein
MSNQVTKSIRFWLEGKPPYLNRETPHIESGKSPIFLVNFSEYNFFRIGPFQLGTRFCSEFSLEKG